MYDVMLDARNSQDMKQVANVFGIGRNRMFEFLREKSVLINGGSEHNLPYQKYIDSGYFTVRRIIIHRTNGDELKTQTLVTPKGIGFIGRILKINMNNNFLEQKFHFKSFKEIKEPVQYQQLLN
jgi:anti-repressor protein